METNNKLREALMRIYDRVNSLDENCGVDPVEIRDIARAALAEPARNCEVGTAEEQLKRHGDWCAMRPMSTHPCLDRGWCRKCFADWMLKPYEEGGAEHDCRGVH